MDARILDADKEVNGVPSADARAGWPVFMLFSRLLLFVLFGLGFLLALRITGSPDPFEAVVKWWPFQVVFTNVVCFFLLRCLCRKENSTFQSLICFDRVLLAKDIKLFLLLLVISGPIGYFGSYGATLLMYNNIPPVDLAQPLPIWARVIVFVLFPASNALIETTTYFGYSYERLRGIAGGSWITILIPALFLALQHIGIPLYFHTKYLIWRFLSFLPMAITLGVFYFKTRRLVPIVLGQFLVDMIILVTT